MDIFDALRTQYPARPTRRHGHDIARAYRDPVYLVRHHAWLLYPDAVRAAQKHNQIRLLAGVLVHAAFTHYGEWVTLRYPEPQTANMELALHRISLLIATSGAWRGRLSIAALPVVAEWAGLHGEAHMLDTVINGP